MRKFTKIAKNPKVFLAQKIFLLRISQDLFSSVSSLVPNPRLTEVWGLLL